MRTRYRLAPEKLRWTCDPAKLGFKTTAELKDLKVAIGQSRAMQAMRFGVQIPSEGYNIFVLGPPGTGRSSMTRRVLAEVAAGQPAPSDWIYVHNFDVPNEPRAIELPPGAATQCRDDLHELVEDMQRAMAAAFDSKDYNERRDAMVQEFREERAAELQAFEKEAEAASMAVGRGPGGIIVAPAKDGEVMSPQEYSELPDKDRQALDRKREELQEKLNDILRRAHRKEKRARADLKRLDQDFARFAVESLIDDLCLTYKRHKPLCEHLRAIENDIIENVEAFRARDEESPPFPFASAGALENRYDLYQVNVIISHEPGAGAPIVIEPNPTIDNLTGQVQHRTQMGALVTDHTMIRPGALHRANGGYLVLEVEEVIRRPYAWQALKRAIKHRLVRMESLQDQLRFLSTVTLEPEPIPLNVKVVLVGTPYVYYLLSAYDDDFAKLFKVKADFDVSTRRTMATLKQYARFIAACCRQEKLPHFDARAAARVLEHAARLAADQLRLTTRFTDVADLVREAAYWSRQAAGRVVRAEHVDQAIEQRTWRSNRVEERLLEAVERDIIALDLESDAVGQVNGLSVVPLGDHWFGRPNRITARTFVGKSGVTQIDREARLTGRIHDKGVLTLSGFLHDRFGRKAALTLSASLTFEQSYDTIEGDSASSAELYALLSSLAGVPLNQGVAVTGSVNQLGELQAIGGVNEKVEGFFAACKLRGLTGTQGVTIPRANVQMLMLHNEVVEAVRDGKFHIYAVSNVDEGMETLTGQPMGKRGKDGTFPADSVNAKVEAALTGFAAAYDNHGSDKEKGGGEPAEKRSDTGNGDNARTRRKARR